MPAKPSSSTRAGGSPSCSRICGVALAASAGGSGSLVAQHGDRPGAKDGRAAERGQSAVTGAGRLTQRDERRLLDRRGSCRTRRAGPGGEESARRPIVGC